MAEFVWLRNGDKLPAVVTAQQLLNRTGARLTPDGIFGAKTKSAVQQFQRPRGLSVDGVIGRRTWPRLVNVEDLSIIDCVDIFDPSLYAMEVRDLSAAGGTPITLGGMCNGIEQAVQSIRMSARNLFCLRFHGHGAPGAAGVSDGHGDIEIRSTFRNDPATQRALQKLRGIFGQYGCIQFMHCETGAGAAGREFLNMVARETGVPASAGVKTQYAGNLRKTVRFEGPTRTACPGGRSLQSWGGSRRAFPGMSVR